MSEQTASSKVLLTFELAELILSHLSFLDLISAELVNRYWREVISNSPTLRQNLHLEPDPNIRTITWQSEGRDLSIRQSRTRLTWKPYVETYTIASLHPFLSHARENDRRGLIAFTFNHQRCLTQRPKRWENMFVTQPPCRNIRLEWVCSGGDTTGAGIMSRRGTESIKSATGVQIGMLVNAVREIVAEDLEKLRGRGFRDETALAYARKFMDWVGGSGDGSEPKLERLDCFVDGFILEDSVLVRRANEKNQVVEPLPPLPASSWGPAPAPSRRLEAQETPADMCTGLY